MLQLTPQSRVFLACEAADFRRYVLFIVMRIWWGKSANIVEYLEVTHWLGEKDAA